MSPISLVPRRITWIAAGGVVAAAMAASASAAITAASADAAQASAGSKQASAASAGALITAHSSSLGTLLVNGRGYTLYLFTRDRHGKDTCVTATGCASAWPPVTTAGTPRAGAGVKASLLGTIALPGGRRQVTYAGHPLYTYANDSGPAQTAYVGVSAFGGTWLAVSPSGKSLG